MGENIISIGLNPDSCGCAPRCFSKIRIISELRSALEWLSYRLGSRFGGGVAVRLTVSGFYGMEEKKGQSHISKPPCSDQRRQYCLISFLSICCLATKISLSTVLPSNKLSLQEEIGLKKWVAQLRQPEDSSLCPPVIYSIWFDLHV